MLALPCIEYRMACGGEWHFTGMVGAPVPPQNQFIRRAECQHIFQRLPAASSAW